MAEKLQEAIHLLSFQTNKEKLYLNTLRLNVVLRDCLIKENPQKLQ